MSPESSGLKLKAHPFLIYLFLGARLDFWAQWNPSDHTGLQQQLLMHNSGIWALSWPGSGGTGWPHFPMSQPAFEEVSPESQHCLLGFSKALPESSSHSK